MRHWQAPGLIWYGVVTGGNQPISILEVFGFGFDTFLDSKRQCFSTSLVGAAFHLLLWKPASGSLLHESADTFVVLQFSTAVRVRTSMCLVLNPVPVPLSIDKST